MFLRLQFCSFLLIRTWSRWTLQWTETKEANAKVLSFSSAKSFAICCGFDFITLDHFECNIRVALEHVCYGTYHKEEHIRRIRNGTYWRRKSEEDCEGTVFKGRIKKFSEPHELISWLNHRVPFANCLASGGSPLLSGWLGSPGPRARDACSKSRFSALETVINDSIKWWACFSYVDDTGVSESWKVGITRIVRMLIQV